ncbi:MAG: hypothetical protein V7676_02160 [Parasphingorhabdus sp.]|uniref:hypothetical protein n=1 Tax=Parasphingorhabdus sp. TaxID=2709688 RepID=UPI0030025A21
MMSSIWSDIKDNYQSAWAFALACPILFLIPPFVEFVQHIIEINIGMYVSGEAAKAVANNPDRLNYGFVKVLALLLPGYWFVRYIIYGRDSNAARRVEWPAIGLWFCVFAYQVLVQYWQMFGSSIGELAGFSDQYAMTVALLFFLILSIIGIYLTAFFVALPLGNTSLGPVLSFYIMKGHFWRTIIYMLSATLPFMAVHYALGYGAMGKPIWLVWIIMTIDALVVGFLALLPVGATAIAARYAAQERSISLLRTGPAVSI